MHYISTRNNKIKESFSSILFQGLSKDGGLYLPSEWPQISIDKLKGKTYSDIAFEVIYLQDFQKRELLFQYDFVVFQP